jgi:gamma-glutamylcyclotransferase (GGCT)/AIG2-like uncharacterized protein YtfP
MKKTDFLFSYGILQKEKFQLESLGKTLIGARDSLRGYRLSLFEIKDHFVAGLHPMAMLTRDNNDIIDGTIYEITVEELDLLDSLKVDDYKRVKEILESGKEAWVYVAV